MTCTLVEALWSKSGVIDTGRRKSGVVDAGLLVRCQLHQTFSLPAAIRLSDPTLMFLPRGVYSFTLGSSR